MSEPLIQNQEKTVEVLAQLFVAMSDRMVLNKDGAFGGAFVIVPPKDGGDPIETLVLDSRQDPAMFWMLLKTKAEMQIAQIDQLARNQGPFARR